MPVFKSFWRSSPNLKHLALPFDGQAVRAKMKKSALADFRSGESILPIGPCYVPYHTIVASFFFSIIPIEPRYIPYYVIVASIFIVQGSRTRGFSGFVLRALGFRDKGLGIRFQGRSKP